MSKKNVPSKPKLRVRKELLKRLSDDDLDMARGGGSLWFGAESVGRGSDSLNCR